MTDEILMQLALWLTYKSVEDDSYWKYHLKAQAIIRQHYLTQVYYDNYFFPFCVKEDLSSQEIEKKYNIDFDKLVKELTNE